MKIMLSTDPIVERYLKNAIKGNVPFQYNDTTFVNLKNFYDFITDNVKAETIDFEEFIKDVIERSHDRKNYELGSSETKSGHAEDINFKVEYEYDEETDELKDYTITF